MEQIRLLANLVPNRALIPEYLSTDYDSFVNRVVRVLKKTDQFKDYNFEGSNIRLLIELQAYQSQLNMFYVNKIAKNVYDDTADLYENLHRIAKMKGYSPRGYISATGEVLLTIAEQDQYKNYNYQPGDTLYVAEGSVVYATLDGVAGRTLDIPFTIDTSFTVKVPSNINEGSDGGKSNDVIENDEEAAEADWLRSFDIEIPVVQGIRQTYTYKASDIVDNKLILPFYKFNHDASDEDATSTVRVEINGSPWTRVTNFFEYISGVAENNLTDNVYMLTYDKFKRYIIEFSSFRNVPSDTDTITVSLLVSRGEEGNLGMNFIKKLTNEASKLVYNYTQKKYIDIKDMVLSNVVATYGGSSPQTSEEITAAGKGYANSQERTVTKNDYISFVKARADVTNAYVWGEKEVEPKGHTSMYNKVYISIIPASWSANTMDATYKEWSVNGLTDDILVPIVYSEAFKKSLLLYLEPRKMLTVYEELIVPDLIYFAFNIGLKVKRTYNFVDVAETVKSKLNYYFMAKNRKFHEKIDFKEIHNYLLNVSQTAEGYDWSLIAGIDNIVFREIILDCDEISQEKIDFYAIPEEGGSYFVDGEEIFVDIGYDVKIKKGSNIYPPNREGDYPQYTRNEFLDSIENKIKVIELGFNQFPMLAVNLCTFEEEI